MLAHYLVEQGFKPADVRKIVANLREEFSEWPLATAPLEHDGRVAVIKRADGYYDIVSADAQEARRFLRRHS